ncbi:tobamovirus multiplication protein 2A-like [Arachis stenosperma]|uniref:tobamovirus multiplication protein 2A-like n=1 Tax=Arachis stenosperma TaxID=217475 RepID=UPI0025AC2F99|nr:tobamovirus multiplication protein 2A-like [Arachis stenosperma]
MASKPFVESILQLINTFFIICGLWTLGYGIICLLKWKQNPLKDPIPNSNNAKLMIVHRLLLSVELSKPSFDLLPKAWFIYLLIGIGGILLIISCSGFYCVFLALLVIVELWSAAFIFFTHNWEKVIPKDTSGRFISVYGFMNVHWSVLRWIGLGVFVLQVIAMLLALYLRSVFKRDDNDNDDNERIVHLPRVRPSNNNYRIHEIPIVPKPNIQQPIRPHN